MSSSSQRKNKNTSHKRKIVLDDDDHKILSVLKENSRLPLREMARKTKIRPSTLHQRIQKLRDEGVIEKFTVKLNNALMGEDFIVFMWVETETDLDGSLFRQGAVREVFGVTGEYDLLLKLKFGNVEEFNQFVIDFRKVAEVRKTLTMVVTTTLREEL